jgi:flagellar L-ring protein precursor FlgH
MDKRCVQGKKSVKTFLASVMAVLITLLAGCAGGLSRAEKAKSPTTGVQPPPAVYVKEAADPADKSSLWQDMESRDLFQDLRAYQVGDLVTVNVVETAKASKKANTTSSRESSIDAGITNLLGVESQLHKVAPSNFSNTAMFKTSLQSSFDGAGSTSRDESMTAYLTARVTRVMPNGSLYIKGTRQVKVNNETQFITLSGIIRREDISPDNTVLSSYIADASIEYTGSGPVSDKQRAGWLGRAVDFVWPF